MFEVKLQILVSS